MASLCKSQQCSIERRGFRQELDSWRHKLIHCVGFETILEGLFGPALLNDLSLFKDCEPTGVCDWSFDENCLFCCLRREKVKEHLAGFHKPINESGQENFLKQEQAKIIRLERQAEEFINAVFYKKDSPRISDPNIPLVAREIMQRMIRQFAAEYTSKNSSTQDSSRPNSTKNQSLPKSPSGQSSPPPATTQNPVLSKLLMADQDSPLDLTVKKPPSEEPCEQADGVLDLSTKKSPCSGSPNSSISPSTSNTIGNGTQDTERKAIDPDNSTNLSLEKFMAKLCSHHQKQFFLVLKNLCTEESIKKSKSRSASVSEIENANLEDNDHSCCEKKSNLSLVEINRSVSDSCLNGQVCINIPTDLHEDNCHYEMSHCSNYLSMAPISSESKEDHVINLSYATDQTITNNAVGISNTEEKNGSIVAKMPEVSQTIFLEHCVLSHSNSTLNMPNDSPGSELSTNIPKIANKENTQYINPKQTFLDCSDCKLKQENSVTTVTVKKLGNFCESPFQNLTDHSGSTLQKVRLHESKRLKTVKCKNSRVLMTNDCDKQCDIVYISKPITTECHFENHKSVVCARNTARKSTRGNLFSGDCCELSTVRTLVKSSKFEEKANSTLHIAEALIIPKGLIETLPSTDVSLTHVEEKRIETDSYNSEPQNDEMKDIIPDTFTSIEPEICNQSLGMAEEPAVHISNSSITVFSLTKEEPEKILLQSNYSANEHVDEIPKMTLNYSVINTEAHSSVIDYEKNIAELSMDPNIGFSLSNNSCSQEDSPSTQSLDMEVTASLNNNHVLSEQTSPECHPYNSIVEEGSATLQYSHTSPSNACLFINGTADKDLPNIGSSILNYAKILPEDSSQAVIADLITSDLQLSIEMSSETLSDIPKDNSESQISTSSQVDLNTSASGNELHEYPAYLKGLKIEHLNKCQNLDSSDSVEMETKDVLLERIDALTPAEHFDSPFNICAKSVGNNNVKLETNVSEENLYHCDNMSSSESRKNYTFRESFKTKEVIGESSSVSDNLDKFENLLISNKKSSKPLTPLKRHKKVPAPTDRCLRSHETHDTHPPLQVLLSCIKDGNLLQRSVVLRTENIPCSGSIVSIVDTIDCENYFAASLNGHCREGKTLFCEELLKSSPPFKVSENLKVCFKMDCDKRIISFTKEDHNSLSLADEKCKCCAKSLRNTYQLKMQKCNIHQTSISSTRARNSSKDVVLKTLKDKMYCKSGKAEKLSTRNKQSRGSNQQVGRPKFIGWCSEEENQESITNFNDMYTAVHKNWISLERETVNVTKSKNKADKLKEIWKTKKRVRRPKIVQNAPKCSPVQMLFTNSSKFSDICRWFMETTETKSLVIVKKLNTRLPEEHQLPMMQSPKYPSQSLYPHILQAQRLKKHLKKFASVFPARNDINTQNAINKLISNSSVPLNQVTKDTVKSPNDCKKQEPHVKAKKTASVHTDHSKYQPCTANKNKKACITNNTRGKAGNPESLKVMSTSDLSLQKVPSSITSKSLIVKNTSKKRNRNDTLIESLAQPNKKSKIDAKQELFKNGPRVSRNAVSTKTKVRKLSKIGLTSNSHAPKKQVGKSGVFKTTITKGKTKIPMQKQSLKSQLVLKRETRSAKLRQVPTNTPKITGSSSSHRKKKLCKNICTVSEKNKRNVASPVRPRKQRSQLEPSTRKGRSLESK